ncbi:MAG: lytic transglycosylase domain-containing protein [Firmicutes bacterium]|nr:lytic transglycosylase domain-containing protein [Bacillota bacterium]
MHELTPIRAYAHFRCRRRGWPFAAAVSLLALTAPAEAQIMAVQDPSGKRVYVNAEPPTWVRTTSRGRGVSLAAPVKPGGGNGPVLHPNRPELERLLEQTAERHQIDPALVRAVVAVESAWDPRAVSPKGAMGLMQLMPERAARLGVSDPFDPEQNLDAGVRHLRELLERYDGNLELALAAYNAGPGAVDRNGRVPNIPETQDYVRKITEAYFRPEVSRQPQILRRARPIYRIRDESGKVVFMNQ